MCDSDLYCLQSIELELQSLVQNLNGRDNYNTTVVILLSCIFVLLLTIFIVFVSVRCFSRRVGTGLLDTSTIESAIEVDCD